MTSDALWIRVLGPLELGPVGTDAQVRGTRLRKLLALLVAARGSTVSSEALIDLLWGDDLPASPTAALHSQVARLRRSLGDLLARGFDLVSREPGYALVLVEDAVDSLRFERLVDEARASGGDVAGFDDALALWRGPAYGEFADLPPVHLEGIRLDELRASVFEERAEGLLGSGRAELVVPEMEAFATEHPLRERAHALLMRALYATGRQSEALGHFEKYRRRLAEELGLEPTAALRRLEHQILTHDLSSSAAATPPAGDGEAGLDAMQVRYVKRHDGMPIATTTIGTGAPLIVVPAWVTSLDVIVAGRDPRSTLVERLVQCAAVTLYDRLGTGLSRGPVDDFSADGAADELISILEHTGGGTVLAVSQAGPIAVTAAARRPNLVSGLVLFGTFASGAHVFENRSLNQAMVDLTRAGWAMGARLLAGLYRPGASTETTHHLAAVLRDSADPETAAGYLEESYRTDVTALLGEIKQPSLVIHYRGDRVIPYGGGQQLASGLPNAEFVPLEGRFHLPDAADLPRIVELIREFVAAESSHRDS